MRNRKLMTPTLPWRHLAIGWLTVLVVGTELFVFSPLLPLIADSYQLSPERIGFCVTAFSAAYVTAAPLLGLLSDRTARRSVLTFCLIAFSAANLATALAGDLPWLIAARLCAGAAAAGISPSIYALVGGAAPPDRRATWLAFVVSGLLLSLVLGAPAGTIAGALIGWRPVFLVLAAAGLALAWPNYRVWPPDVGAQTIPDPALKPMSLAVRMLPMVAWSMGVYGVYTYLGAGLAENSFSAEQIARAILFYGLGAILGIFVGGRMADRLGPKIAAEVSLLGLSGCFLLLRFGVDIRYFFDLALALTSAVAQLFFPAQQLGLVIDFPSRRTTALAWNNSALFLGIMLGSVAGGEAMARSGIDANFVVSAGIALIGCVLNMLVVPRPPPSLGAARRSR
jgi:predicted MFS family arabinose efflux permease